MLVLTGSSSFKQEAHTFDSKVRDVFTFVISVNVGFAMQYLICTSSQFSC